MSTSAATSFRGGLLAVLTALAVTCSTALTGCGSTSAPPAETRLSVWSWRVEDQSAYREIFAEYERTHPGVRIDFRTFRNTEYLARARQALARDGGPDIVQMKSYGQLQEFVDAGRLVALDSQIGELNEVAPEIAAGVRGDRDGRLYGVPYSLVTLQVFYNKKIFTENRIQPPTTWAELIAVSERLKQRGITPFSVSGKEPWTLPILHEIFGATRYGGRDFGKAVLAGARNFADRDYAASLDVVRQLRGYFPARPTALSYVQAQELFLSGQAAMFPGGSYELAHFQRSAPDLPIGSFEAPPAPGAKVEHPLTPWYVDGSYALNAKSHASPAALDLLRWMATPEFGQRFSDQLKQLSPIHDVHPSDALVQRMWNNYVSNGTPYLMLVHFRNRAPTGTELTGSALQGLLAGELTATQAAARIHQGITTWFRPPDRR